MTARSLAFFLPLPFIPFLFRSILFLLVIGLSASLPAHLTAAPRTVDYTPFETRDQNLFNLIHGQALPSNAALLKKHYSRWSSSLSLTNTLNTQSSASESIYLDYEAYRFNFSYQYGLSDNWNLKLDIPLMHQGGGHLDSAIDNWHQFFDLPRANRPFIENNQYSINYTQQTQARLHLTEADTHLADIQIAVSRALLENDSTRMSLWAGLKLPTGDKNRLSGNGATDVSTWLALNQLLADNWLINANAGVVILGSNRYQNIAVSDQVFYGHLMLGWLITDRINLKVQLQGHTSYYDQSRLTMLGDSYLLNFGASIKINQCQQLDIAFSEDIKVEASPDASLLINWRSYPSDC